MTIPLGPDWERRLWASPYRLRFELNRGASYVTMFTSSYDRARVLARAALRTDNLVGVIAAYPDPQRDAGAKQRGWKKGTAFGHLEEMGVPTEPNLATWTGYPWPDEVLDDEDKPWLHRAVSLTWDQADILLWNQVAHDIGVMPQAPVMSKLVDLQRGVSVNAYDDRGMDVTSIDRETISGLHRQFDAWLLDDDRPRMTEAFGG